MKFPNNFQTFNYYKQIEKYFAEDCLKHGYTLLIFIYIFSASKIILIKSAQF